MKVLKFGGSSVGTVESICQVKKIVEACDEPAVVVVSALGGITDQLIATSFLARSGDASYISSFETMAVRHHKMIDAVIKDSARKEKLLGEVDSLLDDLKSIYHGVYLLRDLSSRVSDAIVSYGERISSRITAALIEGAVWYDSTALIKTEKKGRKNVLDIELTEKLIKEAFSGDCERLKETCGGYVAVAPGFISSDTVTGEITNLGRGGSDYTAAIYAASLGAGILEIWTDVDGFLTADPRVVKNAFKIDRLSYMEAMELCNFGAKVIYPPTLYPVCAANIPILIKNTFNPANPGTVIDNHSAKDGRIIQGISSINDTSLITISGPFMVGVAGISSRIFSALAEEQINVIFISQASSEISISVGVRKEDGPLAQKVLNKVFEEEIKMGAMYPMRIEEDLATVAVVGDRMRQRPGIAGKLFSILGNRGISIKACAQGASETNISFVIRSEYLKESLNAIHEGFFLDDRKELNLFICGTGTVGGALISQIESQSEFLSENRGLLLSVKGIARSTRGIFSRSGIDLKDYRTALESGIPLTAERLKDEITGMQLPDSVFVDCTASAEVASLYEELLSHGINVVAANKIAASSPFTGYARLKDTARRHNARFLYEANVGAGLPVLSTVNALRCSGDRIERMQAVVSGTMNFIFNTISEDIPISRAVRMALEQGFSEPDPRTDLSGRDVIRKLVILAREWGLEVEQEDVVSTPFIPQELFDCSLEEFWTRLPSIDERFEKERKRLAGERKRWRFVAELEDGRCSVSLREIEEGSPMYDLEGSNNIILLTTERYHNDPLIIKGYGAGAGVTAAGVFGDILSIAGI
ncbi:MAG: bifunctional aspartate kinase/homoserine dehydrogenase I [Bacteroidales bacterium]|nr:bifunctional aspartate kinase/homoserine dehydrogenase I [Candidatus Cacconaster merdequi]